ncbi:MAG: hypothetical protein R3A51_05765 [Nannocystaceae bacterium]
MVNARALTILALLPSLPAACGDSSGRDDSSALSGGAPTGAPTTASTSASSGSASSDDATSTDATASSGDATAGSTTATTTASSTASESDVSSSEPGPDLEPSADLPADEVCTKVDVLLVIDASSSMTSEIATLPATFAEMKDVLETEVGKGIDDFHIAVMNACPKPPYFHNYGADDTDCGFPGGQNWLASDTPGLDAKFTCVADIPLQDEALADNGGDNGGYDSQVDTCLDGPDEDEQPALTAAAALQPGVRQNGAFLRSDAVLLVIAVTDEDEALANVGSPQAIHDQLASVKSDANNLTFLGVGGAPGGCQSVYDGDDVKDSKHLRAVAEAFGDRGLFRDMCSGPDPLRDAFVEALTTVVHDACEQFIPE